MSVRAASNLDIDGGANLQEISFSSSSPRPMIDVRRIVESIITLNFHQLARTIGKLRDLTNILQRIL